MYCTEYFEGYFADVSNQIQCQTKCAAISACIGVSYSHKPGNENYCYVCKSDGLTYTATFGFYRKPSKLRV